MAFSNRATFSRPFFALKVVFLAITGSQSTIGHAQSEVTSSMPDPSAGYEEWAKENPDLAKQGVAAVAQLTDEEREAIMREARGTPPATDFIAIRSALESVAATARCQEGYVLKGNYSASDSSVVIVSEELRDCDADGCRAYEVTAIGESGRRFDLDVSVLCSM